MAYKVLAVGYNRNEYEIICPKLLKKNVETDFSETTQKAQCLLREKSYDWAIFHSRVLDSLPYVNVMRSIRHIPIIIVDPEGFGIEQISDVLECFADFSSKRRNSINSWTHSFEHGNLHFDQDQRMVSVCGKKIELTAKEFELLALLISNPNRVFTYEMIADIVWFEDYDVNFRKTITNHISSLRQKLRITQNIPNFIKSVHNVGYKFNI
jgi:DNA-binding winged helix-turn-helix (wHTH) protein|nr:winged helix-turn-helix domain-containing protein [uncultured Acetatifactor sp.]